MTKRPKTWREIKKQRLEENFVGREEQLRIFEENFRSEIPQWMVLSVTGEGGVGKSTLLKRYTELAPSPEIASNVVQCTDRHLFPVEVMGAIAEQLARKGIARKEFDERYKKYLETRQQIESDPAAPRGMVDVVTRGVTDFAVKSLRRAPGVGVFADYVDEKAAGDAMVELTRYAITRWGNKDEVQLVREPEKTLTPLFVNLLNDAAEQKRLIVMFDVFERTAGTLSTWLLNLFNCEYGDLSSSTFFIVSGRDPLEQHWTELAGMIAHITLEPFTAEETRQYLANRQITDEALVRQIHLDTGGLPVLVELLAGANPQPGQPLPDVSQKAVERFLQWTPDEPKRRAALLASIPRQFNQKILATVLQEDAATLFYWIATQSYIRSDNERGWFYHERVRELMLRYLNKATPEESVRAHQSLAEYFTARQSTLSLEAEKAYQSDTWRRWEVERVYHAWSASQEPGWSELFRAFMAALLYRRRFAGHLARVAGQVVAELRLRALEDRVASFAHLITAYENDEHDQVLKHLNSFQAWIHELPEVGFAYWFVRGATYLQMRQTEKALDDLDRAIQLDENFTRALALRGATHLLMGQTEKASVDFDRVIQLDENYAEVIADLREGYRELGQAEKALADAERQAVMARADAKRVYGRAVMAMVDVYRAFGQDEQVLAYLDQVIQLDENNAWQLAIRGGAYQQMGQYEKALADLDRAIQLDESFAWAIASRGETYRLMGHNLEAVEDFTTSLMDRKPYIGTLTRRAAAYLALQRVEDAHKDLEQALSLECGDHDDHYERALALIMSQRIPEAMDELSIAFADPAVRLQAQRDDLLDPVRHLPEFLALAESPAILTQQASTEPD